MSPCKKTAVEKKQQIRKWLNTVTVNYTKKSFNDYFFKNRTTGSEAKSVSTEVICRYADEQAIPELFLALEELRKEHGSDFLLDALQQVFAKEARHHSEGGITGMDDGYYDYNARIANALSEAWSLSA